MQTVLVTGGAGYIGSHVCKELALNGYLPVTYDNLSRGHQWAVKWGPLEIGDILDENCLKEVIKKHKPSIIIHFAAYAYVGESVKKPDLYYQNNVIGTFNLLKVLEDIKFPYLIFSSSCSVYGNPKKIPINESHPQKPVNPYGKSKLMIEHMLRSFDSVYGLKSISLRYFNAAGADPDGEIGEIHDPEPHIIPRALKVASGELEFLDIYGDDYKTPDGTCTRDYVHVKDLARIHVISIKHLFNSKKTQFFNVGSSKGYSVKEVVESVKQITGKKITHKMRPRREGDPEILIADSSHVFDTLKWQPEFSALDNLIKDAWNWQKKCLI